MQLSEKELEDFIFKDITAEDPGKELLSRGFKTRITEICNGDVFLEDPHWVNTKYARQLDLGSYGRLDIVGYCRVRETIYIDIFELKSVPIDSNHVDQVCRYKSAIEDSLGDRFQIKLKMYLVGPSISSGHFISNSLHELNLVTYSYSLAGIHFDMNGFWTRKNDNYSLLKSIKNAETVHRHREVEGRLVGLPF